MPLEFRFDCPLIHGLHARPASMLAAAVAETCEQCEVSITLTNERSGATADARSVLELIAAGVLHNDPCLLVIAGTNEPPALDRLSELIVRLLPEADHVATTQPPPKAGAIPRLLGAEPITCLAGSPIVPGIGFGCVVFGNAVSLPDDVFDRQPTSFEASNLAAAFAKVRERLDIELELAGGTLEHDLLLAQSGLLKDPALLRHLEAALGEGQTAAQAIVNAISFFSETLRDNGSAYLRERVVDLQDLGAQLLQQLLGYPLQAEIRLSAPSILVAPQLAPRQFLALDRALLQGLVLSAAGTTSHAVILARSFGIPTIAGLTAAAAVPNGTAVVVDGARGLLLHPVTDKVRRFYTRERDRDCLRSQRLAARLASSAATCDGVHIEVAANIGSVEECATALQNGAEGIGLLRTELLFAGRGSAPSEDEQFEVYRGIAAAMDGRPVIIRTIDVGGDKPLAYLNLPHEENPFLGYRGARIYADHGALIGAQLRAILRASAFGKVRVMAPMVSTVAEARAFHGLVQQAQAELAAQGIAFDAELEMGAMIEVPAAALSVEQLATACDFFSIGTNDLAQYCFAADRGNPQVAGMYSLREPAFLRLLHSAVEGTRRGGRWIGLCGELAGDLNSLPLLVGLGLNELSLSAPGIPALKAALAMLDADRCRELLSAALKCEDATQVDALLHEFALERAAVPLLDASLIRCDSNSSSKAEAIKELADLLYAMGRTDDADALETAVWAREETYSTGLGHGFAIPHCKTDCVDASTLAVLKLAQPVDWGALDGAPVQCVILLVIRQSDPHDTHMRVFARLARRLMREEFRAALQAAVRSDEIITLLTRELELTPEV